MIFLLSQLVETRPHVKTSTLQNDTGHQTLVLFLYTISLILVMLLKQASSNSI